MNSEDIEKLIIQSDMTKEEQEHLKKYAESLLGIKIDFENKLLSLKNNVEFSNAVIDIVKNLTKEYKNVKRNS